MEPKFAQKWILGSEFQKSKSGFGISTSNILRVPISIQIGKLLIFWPKFGKIRKYVQYFGSNIVEDVAESWVEAEMSWVEVDGAGWRWVHGLVIPFIKVRSLINFNVSLEAILEGLVW